MKHTVDPKLWRTSKAKSSIESCIGQNYERVYEVGCLILALKNWYLYIPPNTPETTFGLDTGDETLLYYDGMALMDEPVLQYPWVCLVSPWNLTDDRLVHQFMAHDTACWWAY